MYAHQALTNGQPMNDKRNGRSWSNRQEQLETSVRRLAKEVEDQAERVSKLENQKEAKELGDFRGYCVFTWYYFMFCDDDLRYLERRRH